MRPPQRPTRDLTKPQIPNLALLFQLHHRPHRHLNRRLEIDAVRIKQIDAVDAQRFEALLTRLAHPFGVAAEHEPPAADAPRDLAEEFGAEED